MISIIIPSYNTEHTLASCLDAVYDSRYNSFEVIVVDDGSTDGSVNIAKKYPCKIVQIQKNKGLSHARNTGVQHASYEILVFIDADVVIKENTLSTIVGFFNDQKDVSGVVGLLDEQCPCKNFLSQYKNLYMNYVFNSLDSQVNFLYGSLHALRKKVFQPYDESLPYAEDTELGQRLASQGEKIILIKEMTVTHLKKHNLMTIIKNDFRIPFYWAHLFLRYINVSDLIVKKKFAHAKIGQLFSVLTAPLIVFFFILSFLYSDGTIPILGLLFLLFVSLNKSFFHFLYKKRGIGFAIKSVFFTLLDQLVMAFGIGGGTIHYFSPKKR